jgi:transcriptional regulator NrdR family protein
MKCPECGYPKLIVLETREREDHIYRRKECYKCQARTTTKEYEVVCQKFVGTLESCEKNNDPKML